MAAFTYDPYQPWPGRCHRSSLFVGGALLPVNAQDPDQEAVAPRVAQRDRLAEGQPEQVTRSQPQHRGPLVLGLPRQDQVLGVRLLGAQQADAPALDEVAQQAQVAVAEIVDYLADQ